MYSYRYRRYRIRVKHCMQDYPVNLTFKLHPHQQGAASYPPEHSNPQ